MSQDVLQSELLQRRLSGLMKLVEVTRELTVENDLDRVLQIVTEGACCSLQCERASLFLHDQSVDELVTRISTELEIEEIRISIEEGIVGWVARRLKVANIPDPQADARWDSMTDRKTGFITRNILALPIVSAQNGKLIGVLQLLNKENGGFDSHDEEVGAAFAFHAASAIERAQLHDEVRHSHDLRVAIEFGRTIQHGFLPRHLPEIPGYDVAAWWVPAETVSGDYYDVVALPDGRQGLVIADVSGHGFGPALIMASLRAMLHVLTRTVSDPSRIISLLAETIQPDLQHGRFITLLMTALDTDTHELTFSNAGHGPALVFHRATQMVRPLESTGLPMGVSGNSQPHDEETLQIEPGDVVVLATDGVVEQRNERLELFGRQRLYDLIAEHHTRSAGEIMNVITGAITRYQPERVPHDDITLMVLKRML